MKIVIIDNYDSFTYNLSHQHSIRDFKNRYAYKTKNTDYNGIKQFTVYKAAENTVCFLPCLKNMLNNRIAYAGI